MLLHEDPAIRGKIEQVASAALHNGDEETAIGALYLAIYWAGERGREKFLELVSREPGFQSLSLSGELRRILAEFRFVTLFE